MHATSVSEMVATGSGDASFEPNKPLTHCGLVTPYDDRNQAITWTNIDGSISEVQWHSYWAISHKMPQPPVTKICLKITSLKLHSNFAGANKLTESVLIHCPLDPQEQTTVKFKSKWKTFHPKSLFENFGAFTRLRMDFGLIWLIAWYQAWLCIWVLPFLIFFISIYSRARLTFFMNKYSRAGEFHGVCQENAFK